MSPFFHFSTESEKYISVCSLLNGKHFALPLQRVGSKVLCFKSGTFSLGDRVVRRADCNRARIVSEPGVSPRRLPFSNGRERLTACHL